MDKAEHTYTVRRVFRSILIGVDGRDGGRDATALARQLADPTAQFSLANVYGAGLMPGRGAALLLSDEREHSQQLLEREREQSRLEARLHPWAAHSVGRGLSELADHLWSDLLVVGSCRRGMLGRILLGNDAINALNGSSCAVAIAPLGYATAKSTLRRIGVGYDGSTESERALAAARELAARWSARLTAIAVVSLQSIPYGETVPDNWPEVAEELMDTERRHLSDLNDVEGQVTYGEPSEELARLGEQLDLLVVGSRSYGPPARLIHGSTSNYLARRARCPLLILPRSAERPKGRPSPTERDREEIERDREEIS